MVNVPLRFCPNLFPMYVTVELFNVGKRIVCCRLGRDVNSVHIFAQIISPFVVTTSHPCNSSTAPTSNSPPLPLHAFSVGSLFSRHIHSHLFTRPANPMLLQMHSAVFPQMPTSLLADVETALLCQQAIVHVSICRPHT